MSLSIFRSFLFFLKCVVHPIADCEFALSTWLLFSCRCTSTRLSWIGEKSESHVHTFTSICGVADRDFSQAGRGVFGASFFVVRLFGVDCHLKFSGSQCASESGDSAGPRLLTNGARCWDARWWCSFHRPLCLALAVHTM